MRIGMILDKVFPPDPRVENEAISLINNGHEVFLFCLNYSSNLEQDEINKIQVKRYSSNKLLYKFSALVYTVPIYSYFLSKKIKHFIQNNKIEAIHIHDMQIAQAVFNVNKKLNLPCVLDLHDNMPEVIKLYPHLQKFPGKYIISPKKWKIKEEIFIKKATKVCTVSQEFVNEIIDRTKVKKSNVVLVPNSVRKSFYENSEIDNKLINRFKSKFVILYLGDTAIRRGLLTAIRALTDLEKIIPNIELVIVGKNTTDYILKEEVKKLNVSHLVSFEGWKNVQLFPSYIKSSSICISPLYRNIQHDVAYANKLFQYMSFAKPVLVSNAIAQKNVVEKNKVGLVHKEQDPIDFTKKILEFYNKPKLMKELGENGKRFIEEKFNWEITSKNLIDLYANLKK